MNKKSDNIDNNNSCDNRKPEACAPIGAPGITVKRRNLPHWHSERCIQFVTFHLADSLPATVREELQAMKDYFKKQNPEPWSEETKSRFNRMLPLIINNYLDAGYGGCCLKRADCSKIMKDAIEYFDGDRYLIHTYVIMPNHVHALIELTGTHDLSQICKSWKNFSALKINRLLGNTGRLWHHESWDRMIRNEHHYNNIVAYIEKNINQGGVIWR